ncbi:hypothetical protein [Limnobacter sp.]|uniref:hypothetical protein n=1 Tax=Limnobacter sp. TaxID=2003368 RepID=UPI0025828A28|nr:hypothetical protein [Limnobacter sp.]HEX5486117.1 hypothetical protein [Limnobacter sp.]
MTRVNMALNLSPKSFESARKLLNGFWIVVPAYMVLSLFMPFLVLMALVLTVLHALEIPVALIKLRGKNLPTLEVASKTLLYGFTWWLPKSLEA